jgi:hypothetical protein
MNTLYMKIHAFDEQSNSLIVSFASDTTKSQNPDDYPSYAYQPLHMWPDVTDPVEIKKRIAVAGIYHAEQQEREETFVADPVKVQSYKDMVGQAASYDCAALVPPPTEDLITSNLVVV